MRENRALYQCHYVYSLDMTRITWYDASMNHTTDRRIWRQAPQRLINYAISQSMHVSCRTAILLEKYGETRHMGRSSGNELWAIVSPSRLETIMYRYDWQDRRNLGCAQITQREVSKCSMQSIYQVGRASVARFYT